MARQGLVGHLTQVVVMRRSEWSVQKRAERRTKRRRVFAFFGALVVILLFSYLFVWQRVHTLELADEHSQRKSTVRLLKEECQSLQYEVEYLASLENIERIARSELSMVSRQEAQLVKFTLPKHAKTPTSASGPSKSDSTKTAAKKKGKAKHGA